MKKIKIAINGFGRIGRCTARALCGSGHNNIEIKAINAAMGDISSHFHLFKYDSTHGVFTDAELLDNSKFRIGSQTVPIIFETMPEEINWGDYDVDIVLECSGVFTKRADAAKHLIGGAKAVIISAPGEGADKTIVYGVNHEALTANDKIISLGSCTTNCLAPIAGILNKEIGIESGFMTTIHSYTNDQNVLDSIHKDKRRARSSAVSMIPSVTGAAKALGLVIPELKGKLDGMAVRVPTPNVSLVDLKFVAKRETSNIEVNNIIRDSVNADLVLKKVVSITDEELVSVDFNHNPFSAIFDTTQTRVVAGKMVRVAAWYDNEWGFSNRMLDVSKLVGNFT